MDQNNSYTESNNMDIDTDTAFLNSSLTTNSTNQNISENIVPVTTVPVTCVSQNQLSEQSHHLQFVSGPIQTQALNTNMSLPSFSTFSTQSQLILPQKLVPSDPVHRTAPSVLSVAQPYQSQSHLAATTQLEDGHITAVNTSVPCNTTNSVFSTNVKKSTSPPSQSQMQIHEAQTVCQSTNQVSFENTSTTNLMAQTQQQLIETTIKTESEDSDMPIAKSSPPLSFITQDSSADVKFTSQSQLQTQQSISKTEAQQLNSTNQISSENTTNALKNDNTSIVKNSPPLSVTPSNPEDLDVPIVKNLLSIDSPKKICSSNRTTTVAETSASQTKIQQAANAESVQSSKCNIQNNSDQQEILTKEKLRELIKEVDRNLIVDEEMEEILIELTNDFVESTITSASLIAKHRNVNTVETKDVQLHLQKEYEMWMPGFGTDEIKGHKRAVVTEAHKQRMSLIRKTLRKY